MNVDVDISVNIELNYIYCLYFAKWTLMEIEQLGYRLRCQAAPLRSSLGPCSAAGQPADWDRAALPELLCLPHCLVACALWLS